MMNDNDTRDIFKPIETVDNDLLGRSRFAERILDRIHAANCPSTIGLYGSWGAGKTSLLKMMMSLNAKVPSPDQLHIVYLDVWPYEVSGDLSIPLLLHVKRLIGELEGEKKNAFERIFKVLGIAALDIALQNTLKIGLADVKGYLDDAKKLESEQAYFKSVEGLVDDIHQAQEDFATLVKVARVAVNNQRLVFLIDNLDRCTPENVVRLLESVKNFLEAPNCTWVFAMDSGVIASYIDRKYAGTQMDGVSYLDKIIPEQYHIPPISFRDASQAHKFLGAAMPSALDFYLQHGIPQLPNTLVPRRLLKTARKFHEARTADTVSGPELPDDAVFALILLYNTWPAFYEHLSSDSPEHIRGVLANFASFAKNADEKLPISDEFTNDQALTFFIRQGILEHYDCTLDETMAWKLANTMLWLREVGLP
jgi:hypothetical protein